MHGGGDKNLDLFCTSTPSQTNVNVFWVIAMTEVLCLTWLSIRSFFINSLGWFHWVECYETWHAIG